MDKKFKLTVVIIMEVILLLMSVTTIVLSIKYKFSIVTPMIFICFSQLSIFVLVITGKTQKSSK